MANFRLVANFCFSISARKRAAATDPCEKPAVTDCGSDLDRISIKIQQVSMHITMPRRIGAALACMAYWKYWEAKCYRINSDL